MERRFHLICGDGHDAKVKIKLHYIGLVDYDSPATKNEKPRRFLRIPTPLTFNETLKHFFSVSLDKKRAMAAFGARGAGYGLDAELCRQREAKYDYEAEDKARVSHKSSPSRSRRNSFFSINLVLRPGCSLLSAGHGG